MKKFGTPTGAGPGWASAKVGFDGVGEPPGVRAGATSVSLPAFFCFVVRRCAFLTSWRRRPTGRLTFSTTAARRRWRCRLARLAPEAFCRPERPLDGFFAGCEGAGASAGGGVAGAEGVGVVVVGGDVVGVGEVGVVAAGVDVVGVVAVGVDVVGVVAVGVDVVGADAVGAGVVPGAGAAAGGVVGVLSAAGVAAGAVVVVGGAAWVAGVAAGSGVVLAASVGGGPG